MTLLPYSIDISPNSNGLPGIGQLRAIVGASMTVGLILAVLALIISAVVWAYGANASNPHVGSRRCCAPSPPRRSAARRGRT